jgi:hypothetical protein
MEKNAADKVSHEDNGSERSGLKVGEVHVYVLRKKEEAIIAMELAKVAIPPTIKRRV